MKIFFCFLLISSLFTACRTNEPAGDGNLDTKSARYKEKHRPQIHFSPPANWMNDPNGMVYYRGEYHFFYQHYPDSNVWGPMHWGHAISRDLVSWENQPIALYPDSLGFIFSGSAVVDSANTSGLGTAGNPPLVAMYTYHDPVGEKAGTVDYQTQGIAFSVDKGRSWAKYDGNPVIKNPGIRDFRDPKVLWHIETRQWIVVLAVQDHIEFWGSTDLKNWKKLSDFGKEYGSHGGVWECPDLFELSTREGIRKWVLLVSINPGAPNGGSGTQYFTGEFDGKSFRTDMSKTSSQWIDYGPDNYAGVTYFNAPNDRKIFIGWMSNWAYGEVVPTFEWRSAATAPRDLFLAKIGSQYYLRSQLSPEFISAAGPPSVFRSLNVDDSLSLPSRDSFDFSLSLVKGTCEANSFSLEFYNQNSEKVIVGFDKGSNEFYLDRAESGDISFSTAFKTRSTAPRISTAENISFTVVTDVSSIEVFFDDGLSLLTGVFFPKANLNKFQMKAPTPVRVDSVEIRQFDSIW